MSSVNDKIPEGWVETTLGKISKVQTGPFGSQLKNEQYITGGTPVITVEHIQDFRIQVFDYPSVTEEDKKRLSKYLLKEGDIVFTRVGSVDLSAYVDKSQDGWMFSSRMLSVRTNEEVDSKFLSYFFRQNIFRKYIYRVSVGATMPSINTGILKGIPISYPPIEEQKAIAQVLTAFDDKIENLRAQNQTLETLAQTIFKEWFLPSRQAGGKYQVGDELPEGWRVGEIGDLTVIKRGGSPRPIKDYISDSGYRWLKISDATATDSPYIFEIKEHIKVEGLSKTTLKKAGDLVLSNSATPGMPKFLAVDTCVHDGWMHFPSSIVSNEYLYLLFLHIRPKLVQQGSGSVFVNLKTDILRYYETIIPSNQALKDFDKLIKPVFDKILNNSKQIQSLTKTRDTLLPKLMSGELRVEGFKK